MVSLLLAAAFFLGIHLLVSGTALRDRLIARLGEGPYRGLFSLASLTALVWLCMAYNRAPYVETWGRLEGLKPLADLLMLIAVPLAVLGLTTRSPTSVGGEAAVARGPVGIQRVTRHPFLWGVALWALVHLTLNGDLAALLLFGSLGLLAALGTVAIDRKRARALGPAWTGFAAASSNLPFAAIAQGRARLRLGEIPAWQWLAALAAYAALGALHPALFGVRAFG